MSRYQYLYTCIKNDILSGALTAGERLPSKRALAEHLGISVLTVEYAYRLLEEEGYVTARQRSGFFVHGLAAAAPVVPVCPPPAPLPVPAQSDSAAADIDFQFSALAKIMRRVITQYDRRLMTKPPRCGCLELRQALSDYLLRYRGMHAPAERIIVGSGSEYLYGIIVQLLGRDRIYGLEDPSYEKIRAVYEANGAVCRMLAMDTGGIATGALNATDAQVLHVTPFHSYPTGITASAAKRFEYLTWADRRGGLIVEDDFDSEFAVGVRPVETIYSMDRSGSVIYLNTFSKSLAPSMRLGYMILPEKLMALYEQKLGFYACTVPVFDQIVLARFIAEGYFERHLNRARRALRQAQKQEDT